MLKITFIHLAITEICNNNVPENYNSELENCTLFGTSQN